MPVIMRPAWTNAMWTTVKNWVTPRGKSRKPTHNLSHAFSVATTVGFWYIRMKCFVHLTKIIRGIYPSRKN